jgi:hypothetical protein
MTRKTAVSILALLALTTAVAVGAAFTPAGNASDEHSSGNQLAGTWIVKVNLPAPQPALTSLQVVTDDGSFIELANDSSGAARTPQLGSWERISGRLYAASGTFFRFNPQTGAHVGSMKILRTIRLSDDGQSLAIVGRASVLDLSGNVVTSFPVTATGERMPVERIPGQP